MNDPRPPLHPASPLLDRCPPSLPAADYFDPARHRTEVAGIWARSWIYAGRARDLPPMTLRRVSVAGENLILLKDADGRVACFHNTCRHRGAELCPAEERQLKSRLISCPYHQWSYDFSGRLVSTAFATPTADFRREEHGLFRVQVHDWNGFVFVCLADAPPDFAAVPDLGPAALANWPLAELVTGHVLAVEVACNWKIFWENYNECLHCPCIHPELCDLVPIYRSGIMAPEEAADRTPGRPPEPGLRPGARSWTVSGQPCGPEFPGLTDAERDAGFTFATLLPSLFVCAHVDYVRAVSLRPLGPERTEIRAEWLFPAETLAAPGFDLADVVGFSTAVLMQDAQACEMNQRGLRSSRFAHGTLMPQEFEVHRFHEWIRGQLAQPHRTQGETP